MNYKMYYQIDEKLEKIIKVHYSKLHEEIRSLNLDESYCYEDIIYYSIEKNLKNFEQRIIREVKDEQKIDKIFKLAKKICMFYDWNYSNREINKTIFIKSKNINKEVGEIDPKLFFEKLENNEKELFNRKFNNRFKFNDKNFVLNFCLDQNKRVNVIEAYYIVNKNEIINLKEDFQGMTLEQIIILLSEFGLKNAKKYVERKREEFIYKTEVIDYIYNYIMYSIMLTNKSLKGAKKAMLFADDYCANINIPIRYAISSNDKYINDIINYYYLLGGKDVECFANYFENQDKLIKFKNKIKLSEIVKAKSKTKIK